MKLTTIEVKAVAVGSFGQNEKRADRENRMKNFWSDKANQHLIPVGRLLATVVNGKTLAAWLIAGESLEMSEVTVSGTKLPLLPGFALSLKNVAQVWGCPACRSAHGTGVYPSRTTDVNEKNLSGNKFFYNPTTKALFVISSTCWSDYVVKFGAEKGNRFRGPETESKPIQSQTKQGPKPAPAVA